MSMSDAVNTPSSANAFAAASTSLRRVSVADGGIGRSYEPRSAPLEAGIALLAGGRAVLAEVLRAARHLHGPRLVGQVPLDVGGEPALQDELGQPEGDGRPGGEAAGELVA